MANSGLQELPALFETPLPWNQILPMIEDHTEQEMTWVRFVLRLGRQSEVGADAEGDPQA